MQKKKSAFSGASSEAGQIKMNCVRVFSPRTVRSNCDYSLEMGLFGKLKPSLVPPVTARLLIFTKGVVVRLLFFKAIVESRRGGLE